MTAARSLARLALLLSTFALPGCATAEFVDEHLLSHAGRNMVRFGRDVSELPDDLKKASSELESAAAQLKRKLTDVPPPGTVTLNSLGHGLERFERDKDCNFLVGAKKPDGTPEDFTYVRIGVDSYDDFFRTAQELHALTYQAKKTIARIRTLSNQVLGRPIDAGANLRVALDRAKVTATGQSKTDLENVGELAAVLATSISEIVAKTDALVTSGKRLVGNAPSDLTNPKLVIHLGLVKRGLVASTSVVEQSGVAMADLMKDLGPFRASGG